MRINDANLSAHPAPPPARARAQRARFPPLLSHQLSRPIHGIAVSCNSYLGTPRSARTACGESAARRAAVPRAPHAPSSEDASRPPRGGHGSSTRLATGRCGVVGGHGAAGASADTAAVWVTDARDGNGRPRRARGAARTKRAAGPRMTRSMDEPRLSSTVFSTFLAAATIKIIHDCRDCTHLIG